MKKSLSVLVLLFSSSLLMAQSETTLALGNQYKDSFSLYFYKNTLRMLNQNDSKEFDELIKNIEKMRFLMIDKTSVKFDKLDYKKLVTKYKSEAFESMVTGRMNGRNFDLYMKDDKSSPLGTIVLINDSTNLYILDIIGTIDLSKASQLFQTLDQSTDIGKKIKNFADRKELNNGKDKGEVKKEIGN